MVRVTRLNPWVLVGILCLALIPAVRMICAAPRVIEVIADKDNRFKVPGQKKPVITVHAKEVIRLRITAHKGTEWEKDGAIHSFTIKELKDQGWDLRLKEGVNEFTLVAPADPREYAVECTVKCGNGHEEMKMTLLVVP